MTPSVQPSSFDLAPGVLGNPAASPVRMLMLTAGGQGLTLSIADNNGCDIQQHVFAPGWRGLLVLDRVACEVAAGAAAACGVDVAALAKLQSFLDAAAQAARTDGAGDGIGHGAGIHASNAAPAVIAERFPAALDMRDRAQVERWFLTRSMRDGCNGGDGGDGGNAGGIDTDFACIAAVLRATEHYKLVRFLLRQPASRTMQDLSASYGLSYSHFRKLCRDALGRGGKAEFQYWRNVRALFDLVDSGGSMTEVAMRQGFASSSHFSDAMKGQFGIAPRDLTRAIDLDKKQ